MDRIRPIVCTLAAVTILSVPATVLGAPFLLPGDANQDNTVDVTDLGILATYYDTGSDLSLAEGDFNNDSLVNVSDLGILATNYGRAPSGGGDPPSTVPEPGSMLVWFGLGVVGMVFWRRRR